MNRRPLLRLHLIATACVLAGCAAVPPPVAPLEFKRSPGQDGGLNLKAAEPVTQTEFERLPSLGKPAQAPAAAKVAAAAAPKPAAAPASPNDEVSIAIEQTPLPMFIQILYGNVLKRPYSLDAAVQSRTEPVTFKTSKPISREHMNELAVTLLRSYRLSVQDLNGLVKIGPETPAGQGAAPQVLQGPLPDSVASYAQIFYYVEMNSVRTTDVIQWLRQIMGSRINVNENTVRNGLLLSGSAADVRAALSLVETFDQPRMHGRMALRITPAYATVSEMQQKLIEALQNQGISAGVSAGAAAPAVVVMGVPSTSSLYVFAGSQAMLDHVREWAHELDRAPRQSSGVGLFTYPVKYADAQSLAETLGSLLGGGGGGAAAAPAAAGAGTSTPVRASNFGRVVVNNATNTLIIRGTSAEEQQQIKDLLRELDRPTKSAMIEVVVAELRQGAAADLGIDWTTSNAKVSTTSTRTVSGGPTGLAVSYVNNARDILAHINALASNSEARVLSNPRVLARNGETATIQVGNEVPVVTSQQSTGTGGGLFPTQTGLIQQIQYRSTGVILRVRPVINSGNRLDLDVSQEVSSASSTQTGVSASPTISTRRIETKLSLRDGSTILLGGLISQDGTVSDSGVPWLKDIPGLGALFKKQSNDSSRTELLVMITPHVINDDFEAEEISKAMRDSFGGWAQDFKLSRVATEPPADQGNTTALPPTPAASAPAASRAAALPVPPSPPAPPASSAAPSPAPAAEAEVLMSKPAEASAPAPAPAASAPAAPPAQTQPATPAKAAPLPAGVQGKQVTDPKVLDDIKKLLQRK